MFCVIYSFFFFIVVNFHGGFLGGGGGFVNQLAPHPAFAAGSGVSAAGGFGGGSSAGSGMGGSAPPLQKVERVRNVFPETWLWTNKTTGYLLWR